MIGTARRKLPKTRSGKIMRRVVKAGVLARDAGDRSTEEVRVTWLVAYGRLKNDD